MFVLWPTYGGNPPSTVHTRDQLIHIASHTFVALASRATRLRAGAGTVQGDGQTYHAARTDVPSITQHAQDRHSRLITDSSRHVLRSRGPRD